MRFCRSCGHWKAEEHFQPSRKHRCRGCQAEYDREFRVKHRDTLNARNAKWRAANKDWTRNYSKEWYLLNKEDRLAATSNWKKANPDRVAAHDGKRRAKTHGVSAESFLYAEIYARDAWTCGICSEPVPQDARWPDPLSASLDHIVPLSKGGTHTKDNTRCTHLACNVRRGNREE